jgi:type II secretory pathway pseudopilin PulG
LPEVIVTVGVIAVLTTIVVMNITGVDQNALVTVADRNLNMLNSAVNSFNNSQWELVLSPNPGTSDERAIFYTLQHRDAVNPVPGSPALQTSVPFVVTSSDEVYRGIWNGRFFQLLEPGIAGEGVDLGALTGSLGGGPPPGFTPVPPQ